MRTSKTLLRTRVENVILVMAQGQMLCSFFLQNVWSGWHELNYLWWLTFHRSYWRLQGVACSISSLSQSLAVQLDYNKTVLKMLFILIRNIWPVHLDFTIQKYPKLCLSFTLHNFITFEKIQITKYTNVIKYIQYIKNACIGTGVR